MSLITHPLIELLAIALYEHDHPSGDFPRTMPNWMCLPEEDRQMYRDIASGSSELRDQHG